MRLLSFVFEDCEAKADKLTLSLDNFDLALFEREELMAGAVLEVSWGYPDEMAPPRRVVVKSVKGFQMITLEGQALAALMNQQAKTRNWLGKARSDVVRAIATENGYEGAFVDVEDTTEVIDVVNQTAETDARFLKRLAAREGTSPPIASRPGRAQPRRRGRPVGRAASSSDGAAPRVAVGARRSR